jgi:hypothetical protein
MLRCLLRRFVEISTFTAGLLTLGAPLAGPAMAQELVRIRVSQLTGTEPGSFSSVTHPSLFALHPSIASVDVTFVNPQAPVKVDTGPATYFPPLTPLLFGQGPVGYIEIAITPATGAVPASAMTVTTAAQFPGNPSSLVVATNVDAFTAPRAVLNTGVSATNTVPLAAGIVGLPLKIRFSAGNDFGENGGGRAGFSTNDLVISRTATIEDLSAQIATLQATINALTQLIQNLPMNNGPGGRP